jgi:Ca2+-binding EF-hand superfamily protein
LHLICRDHDGKVTPEEVAAAAAYLKDTIGKEGVQELISNLSKDKGAYTRELPVLSMTRCQIVLTDKFLCLQMERSVWKT